MAGGGVCGHIELYGLIWFSIGMQKFKNLFPHALFLVFISLIVVSCSSPEINIYDQEIDEDIAYNKDWDIRYDEDAVYYNFTNGRLNIFKGPDKAYDVVDYLDKQTGGFIQGCSFDLKWCFLNFGGKPKSGWVAMEYLRPRQVEG